MRGLIEQKFDAQVMYSRVTLCGERLLDRCRG
jgi:hypothetical protein